MATKKGWKRLAIALGVPYFSVWTAILVGNIIKERLNNGFGYAEIAA